MGVFIKNLKVLYHGVLLWQQLKVDKTHCICKVLGISFNMSEVIGRMIFPQLSVVQL